MNDLSAHIIWLAVAVSLIPLAAVWVAVYLPITFSKEITAPIQAIASGFLLGSIIIDLMPRILTHGFRLSYIISFVIGFALMLLLQQTEGDCCSSMNNKKPLRKFLFPFGVEYFITAVLIGIASSASLSLLLIIAISFGLCNFVCGLSISSRLASHRVSSSKRFNITFFLTLLFPLGAFLSALLVSHIPMNWIHDLLSFAIATLLYLVLNELLPEALAVKKMRSLALLFSAITFVFLLYFIIR